MAATVCSLDLASAVFSQHDVVCIHLHLLFNEWSQLLLPKQTPADVSCKHFTFDQARGKLFEVGGATFPPSPSLPLLSLPLPSIPFLSLPFPSLPLEVGPLKSS